MPLSSVWSSEDRVTGEVLAMLDAETQEEEIIDDESFHLWWFFFFKCSLKKIINFGCAGFTGFSPVALSEGCPAAAAPGFLVAVASLVAEPGL